MKTAATVEGSLRQARCAISAAMLLMLSACNAVGTIESRAESLNKMTADYAASSILYNIVRASNAEPLQFVTITGVTGHETFNASIGLPTIVVGPGRTAAQNLFLFGPNSIGGSESNDFNVNVVDDPQSYAALLRPVDPATLGFMIGQGYDQEVFELFVSRIDVYDPTGKQLLHTYTFEPIGPLLGDQQQFSLNPEFISAQLQLSEYLDWGLSAEADPTFVPQPNTTGNAVLCYDPTFFDEPSLDASHFPIFNAPPSEQCPRVLPDAAQAIAQVPPQKSYRVNSGTETININMTTAGGGAVAKAAPNFSFHDDRGDRVELRTRSVFGAYRFLGEILYLRENSEKYGDPSKKNLEKSLADFLDLINITHDTFGCWARADIDGQRWCVPSNAIETKRVFALLHQLFELYATPNNQTTTPTVRVTP
jgi:hypothetical protein